MKPIPPTSCPISSSSLTSDLEEDCFHLGARQILAFHAQLPAVRTYHDWLKVVEEAHYLAFW